MPNGTWLRNLRAVERDKGVDYTTLACHASELTPYVREQLARAAQGVEEVYSQLPSAVLPEAEQRARWESSREEYVARICEAVQRLGVALTAVGCSDAELEKHIVCEEDANEVKRDIETVSSEDGEDDTVDEGVDSESTVLMKVPVERRTDIQESVI